MCRRGKSYSPRIVRVGLSVHHSVESVALDTLVQKHLQADKVRPPLFQLEELTSSAPRSPTLTPAFSSACHAPSMLLSLPWQHEGIRPPEAWKHACRAAAARQRGCRGSAREWPSWRRPTSSALRSPSQALAPSSACRGPLTSSSLMKPLRLWSPPRWSHSHSAASRCGPADAPLFQKCFFALHHVPIRLGTF